MTDRLRYLRQAKAIPGEETAYVLTRRTVHEQRFVIRPCTENDLPMIMLIQRRVRRRVPSRSLYVMSPRRHVLESIRKDYGKAAGWLFHGAVLAGDGPEPGLRPGI